MPDTKSLLGAANAPNGVIINESTKLAEHNMFMLIWQTAKLLGCKLSYEDVVDIINKKPIPVTSDDMLCVINAEVCWEFVMSNLHRTETFMLISMLNKLAGYRKWNEPGEIDTGDSYHQQMYKEISLIDSINDIREIGDVIERALQMGAYVIKNKLFEDGNDCTGFLIINFILMKNNVGILSIPSDQFLYVQTAMVNCFNTKQTDTLCSVLREFIVKWNK